MNRRSLAQRDRSPPIQPEEDPHVDPGPRRARSKPTGRPARDGVRALDRRLSPSAQGRPDRRDPRPPGRRGRPDHRPRSDPTPTRRVGRRRAGADEDRQSRRVGGEADAGARTPRRTQRAAARSRPRPSAGGAGRRGRARRRGRAAAEEGSRTAEASRRQAEERARERARRGGRPRGGDRRGRGRAAAQRLGLPARQPPEPSEDDVYVSAAQVKRCELVPGDRISGPRRAPRRSERFASLIRIDTINGRPAEEVADGTRFDDLPAAFPTERFRLGSDDPTIKAIEWLTPFGQGSRVTIVGPARAGKTEALRRLADDARRASGDPGLAGPRRRPARGDRRVAAGAGRRRPRRSASPRRPTRRPRRVERVVDQARRLAARGAHAVVLIDTLDGLHPHAARKLLAAARNIAGGGSLTVIATASEPLGGETTVIALDPRAGQHRPLPGARPARQRDDPARAARRRGRRRGDRPGPRPRPLDALARSVGGAPGAVARARPCSAAPARGARAAESMSASRAPARSAAISATACTAQARISTSSGEPCSISSPRSIRSSRRGVVAEQPVEAQDVGDEVVGEHRQAVEVAEARPRRRGPGRRRRSARA